jgi:iron complex outermembrane recepter protein
MKNLFQYYFISKKKSCRKGSKTQRLVSINLTSIFFSLFSIFSFSQNKPQDSTNVNQLNEVLVKSTRVNDKSPFAFTTVKKEKLETTNLGQDLPVLLDQLPSVVTTSDAGAGVGYTGIRVRGSDATRVNVTINGIPYNDAESQSTYFVDLPDFASSLEDVQLQRGVGTSTNGSGAFGASSESFSSISNSIGSFETRKHNLILSTGIKNGFYATGKLSKIASDGYIDRASSDLKSFFAETGFINSKTAIKAIVFGGKEITYQSWYGTPESVVNNDIGGIKAFIERNYIEGKDADNLLNSGRTYNKYLYENQVDNYEQNHYQLHVSHQFIDCFSGTISGNYTTGKGYYEELKEQDKLKKYLPEDPNASQKGDVVRRKWANSNFLALVYSLNYKKEKLGLYLGGGFNKYDGTHFGEVISNTFKLDLPLKFQYYQSNIVKEDYNTYLKGEYEITKKVVAFGDIQFRNVNFKSSGLTSDLNGIKVDKKFLFFNPKAGFTYLLNDKNTIYTSVSVGNREPNGDDLTKNRIEPVAEQLIDYELGYRLKAKKYYASANLYYMHYNNQLVLTGEIDDVGDPIRQNVAKSYRAGIELEAGLKVCNQLRVDVNVTFSENKIQNLNYLVYDTQYDPNTYDTVVYEPISTAYKNTDISFSPNVVASGTVTFSPIKNLDFGFVTKYVDKQYLDNTSTNSKSMPAYLINNLTASFKLKPKWIKELNFNLLINNLLNKKYVSNGYTYSYFYRPLGSLDNAITENFYYPQAGVNFLTGLTLKF